jgi:phosphatidate cytidylyltransferase
MNQLPHNVKVVLLAVSGFLALATLFFEAKRKLQPEKDFSELHARIKSWWVIVGLLFGSIIMSRNTAIWFFAFVSFLALKEYFSLIPTRRADRRILFWGYISIPAQYFYISIGWYGMFIVLIPVYVFLFLPLRMVLIGETKDFLKSVSTIHWGVMLAVFSISHMAYLLELPADRNPAGEGAGLLLYLVLLTQLNDVFQYIWGKSLGRHKIIPKISPNKTVEGLIGGVATTVLLSVLIAPALTPIHGAAAVSFGLLIALGGFIGDVTMSAIKRDLGVKDTGAILPGHGGILDRIDSLTYTAPLFFHVLKFFYYS